MFRLLWEYIEFRDINPVRNNGNLLFRNLHHNMCRLSEVEAATNFSAEFSIRFPSSGRIFSTLSSRRMAILTHGPAGYRVFGISLRNMEPSMFEQTDIHEGGRYQIFFISSLNAKNIEKAIEYSFVLIVARCCGNEIP